MNIKELFTEHPQSVNETYFQHWQFATIRGLQLILLGFIAIIHAVFPFLFVFTVSRAVSKMGREVDNRMYTSQENLQKKRKNLL